MESSLSWPMFCTLLFISLSVVKNILAQTGSCPTTPSSWYHNFSSCYYVRNTSKTNFDAARNNCLSMGADLVCISDKPEVEYLKKILSDNSNGYWIGMKKNFCRAQQRAVYGLSCQSNFTIWGSNPTQPNDATCCIILLDGQYRDQTCSKDYYFICERQEIPATTVPMSTASKSNLQTSSKISSTTPGPPSSPIGLAVGLSVGLAVLIVLIVLFVFVIIHRRNRSKQQNSIQTDSTLHLPSQPQTIEENVYETTASPTSQNGHPAAGYTKLNVSRPEPSAPAPLALSIHAQQMRQPNRQSQNNDLTVVDNGLYTGYGEDDGNYHQSLNGKVDAVCSEPDYVANGVNLVDNSLYEASG